MIEKNNNSLRLIERTPEELACPPFGSCPSVFETNRNSYIVIGKLLSERDGALLPQGRLGKDEVAIEIPVQLLDLMQGA